MNKNNIGVQRGSSKSFIEVAAQSQPPELEREAWSLAGEPKVTLAAEDVRLRYTIYADSPGRSFIRGRRKRQSVPAVRGVSLIVREGEMVGLVGLNGSGKSSLLRVLAGSEPATSGYVFASSQPQLLGVSAALVPDLSGLDNIWLGTLAMGMDPDQAHDAKDKIIELADIGHAIRQPMRTYSSGMAARLRFAISVAANPEILMIDEALATGDAAFHKRSEDAMHELLDRSGTVFLVSHAAKTIEDLCTRAIWLHKGAVVADGPATEVARLYRFFAHALANDNKEGADKALLRARDQHPPTTFQSRGSTP